LSEKLDPGNAYEWTYHNFLGLNWDKFKTMNEIT